MLGAAGLIQPATVWAVRGKKNAAKPQQEKPKPAWNAGKQLVVVLLQGGPDGLSMAVPASDPLYRYLRPTTALAPDCGGADLGEGFLLHPAMSELAPFYARKKLAILPACGLPGIPANHATALAAFAQGGKDGGTSRGRTGWLGRLSVALGGGGGHMWVASQSAAYAGAPHYHMFAPGRGPALPGLPVADQSLFDAVGRLYAGKDPLARLFASGRRERQETLARLVAEARRVAMGAIAAPVFPDFAERFGARLAERRDAALGYLAIGGFDTHSGQGRTRGYLADRLRETARGLVGLAKSLGKAFDDTVIIALGEFGRTARENDFGGTDNGQGGVMFVLGGPVTGGALYGEWPGLAAHRLAGGRDVAVTTDWRDVVAGIATRHLGLPGKRLEEVFPGFTPAKDAPVLIG